MITLKRIDHISMGAPALQPQAEWLERILGARFGHSFKANAKSDFGGAVLGVRGTDIELEIIDPATPTSFVQKFLDESGPGLHHITAEVDDIEAACAELERQGIKPFGGIADDGLWRLTYIHPKDSGGILWQLFVPKRPAAPSPQPSEGGLTGMLRIDHVSMAVADLKKQVEWQTRVLGMEQVAEWTDESLGYTGAYLKIPGSLLNFEILQPIRPDSFVQKFLNTRRPGMHHICCHVKSVDEAVAALRANGMEPLGGIVRTEGRTHTYIHPRDIGGVLFQLYEE